MSLGSIRSHSRALGAGCVAVVAGLSLAACGGPTSTEHVSGVIHNKDGSTTVDIVGHNGYDNNGNSAGTLWIAVFEQAGGKAIPIQIQPNDNTSGTILKGSNFDNITLNPDTGFSESFVVPHVTNAHPPTTATLYEDGKKVGTLALF